MGGQACVLYGAAEFSRDTDIAVLADPANLDRLSAALADLDAKCIAVPPFELEYLLRGHAVHFRCQHPEADGMRIDVMSVMRGVDPFEELWQRRTTVEYGSGDSLEVVSLPDLVAAKKTQRDKDWPMIRRLVEANYVQNRDDPTSEQIRFWLKESRTPEILLDLAAAYPDERHRIDPDASSPGVNRIAEPRRLGGRAGGRGETGTSTGPGVLAPAASRTRATQASTALLKPASLP